MPLSSSVAAPIARKRINNDLARPVARKSRPSKGKQTNDKTLDRLNRDQWVFVNEFREAAGVNVSALLLFVVETGRGLRACQSSRFDLAAVRRATQSFGTQLVCLSTSTTTIKTDTHPTTD